MGARWYAVALLTVPLVWSAVLVVLALTSPAFIPGIVTAEDKASALVAGLVGGLAVGLVASFFEEIGWTGFATAELSKRHGLLATGLIVGVPWMVLHVPLYAGFASGPVPPALNVAAIIFYMLAYRVLMVWVYDRTQSAPMAMLMHLMLILWPFVLAGSPAMVGVPDLTFNLILGATLWALVAAVMVANRRRLSRGGTHARHSTHPRWVTACCQPNDRGRRWLGTFVSGSSAPVCGQLETVAAPTRSENSLGRGAGAWRCVEEAQMCMAEICQVSAVGDDRAEVVRGSRVVMTVSIMVLDEPPAVGDWLLVHAGIALARLDDAEAAAALRIRDTVSVETS